MRNIFIIFILINCNLLFSQAKFQKGYIVLNNEKKECLIKNEEWLDTPKNISYKLTADSPVIKESINEIQELHIYDTNQKYLLSEVVVSQAEEPIKKSKLFLRCLLLGEASLYSYRENSEERFFFKVNDSDITELIHSKEVEDMKINENHEFKEQLFNQLKCSSIDRGLLRLTRYSRRYLLIVFENYNSCKQSEYVNYHEYNSKGRLTVSINGGLLPFETGGGTNSLQEIDDVAYNFEKTFTAGLELEYRLPYDGYVWGIFTEINYRQHQGRADYIYTLLPRSNWEKRFLLSYSLKFRYLELPLGVRYYTYLNSKNSLFYNAALSYNFLLSDDLEILSESVFNDRIYKDTEVKSGIGYNFGVGYRHNSGIGAEFRYSQTALLRVYKLIEGVNSFSILLSYRF